MKQTEIKEQEEKDEPTPRMFSLGHRIKEVRRYFKLTQNEVAKAIGIKQITVSRFEQGKEVSGKNLIGFLDFYSKYISIDYLFSDKFDLISKDNFEQITQPATMGAVFKGNLEEAKSSLEKTERKIDLLLKYLTP